MAKVRTEHDSLGAVAVPVEALWGASTQRAIENFPVSGQTLPRPFIRALGLIKATAAEINAELGLLDEPRAQAIAAAALEVAGGRHDAQFPVDVFQTGSGTSSNMNANEVIAHLATAAAGQAVHPNDHVNLGQSSNDTIPTAIHVAASLQLREALLPALKHLIKAIDRQGHRLRHVVKTGRTHLMDAMPLRFDQELGAWASQLRAAARPLKQAGKALTALAQGATAVGTGVNADPKFAARFCKRLAKRTGIAFVPAENPFAALAGQDAAVAASAACRGLALVLSKIANDLRWMNSGPLAGLGEIRLPVLQPGSSIMPGKVNPVIPESVAMVAAQVVGLDAAIAWAGASGSFQLNTMLPLIAANLLQALQLLAASCRLLADRAIAGFEVDEARIGAALARNPVLITALNAEIGYERGAAIAKQAYAEGRPILEVARECTDLPDAALRALLDPLTLTEGGVRHRSSR